MHRVYVALNMLPIISFYDNQEAGRLYWFIQDVFQGCDQFISVNYYIRMTVNDNYKMSDSISLFKLFLYFIGFLYAENAYGKIQHRHDKNSKLNYYKGNILQHNKGHVWL